MICWISTALSMVHCRIGSSEILLRLHALDESATRYDTPPNNLSNRSMR